uniref:Ig-like domain-containing protein n=1 Tax=Sphenodon punctatus TaxID=8508 RepID=A0A8D0GJ77_SPHPU
MGKDCFLLLLSTFYGKIWSVVVLEQDLQDFQRQENEAVTFHCSMKGGEMKNYWMNWYRLKEEDGLLTWIYREVDRYGAGFQGRFVGTVDSSNNRFTLQIRTAQLGDRAVYFCAADRHSATAVWQSRTKTDEHGENKEVL